MADQTPPWPVCEVHTMGMDMDCEYCEREMDGKQTVLAGMHQGIQEVNMELARMTGQPYVETATAVPSLKVDVLVAMIFQDPKARMSYELNFAAALGQQINEVKKQVVRQQILGAGGQRVSPRQMG